MSPRAARTVGWVLAAIAVGLSVLAIVVGITGSGGSALTGLITTLAIGISLAYSLVGALILSRRPGNGLGWVFVLGGVTAAMFSITQEYAAEALSADADRWGRIAAWVTDISNPLSIGFLTVFVFLLFPEGRFEGPARRWAAVVAVVGMCLAMAGAVLEPTLQEYRDVPSPFAPAIPATVGWTLLGLGITFFAVALLTSIGLLVGRLRRAVGRERDQLRLLVSATAVATVLLTPALVAPPGASWTRATYVLGGLGFLLIPTSVGVAILRHGLLDIDVVIRRTVVVALLGVFITVVYVGVVVGIGTLVGNSGNTVLSAIAAATVALAFQPVRRWAQRRADRLVYGNRATPYEVLHRFSERVAGSYGREDVLPRMAAILGEGTGASRAQVWLRIGSELRSAAVWPDGARGSLPIPARDAHLAGFADVSLAVPVRDRGEVLGTLSITKDASDPVSPTEEKLVADLALQAGLVLRNVRLVEDLRASRGRLVAAQDQERRRLERNIHDGAQQQLVALAVKAKLADAMMDRDLDRAHEMLAQIQAETQETLESLRDLARGIYPPLLADEGLTAALQAQARKAPMPVTVSADGVGRYPQEVEATAYFCCLEALQNASKYAEASKVAIVLSHRDSSLRFTVADDGRGFDPGSARRGLGLQNMTDRLEAVGGSLEVRSNPGNGTAIVGTIVVPAVGAGAGEDDAGV